MILHVLDGYVLRGTWEPERISGVCKKGEEVQGKRDGMGGGEQRDVRWKGVQHKREDELLRLSRAVNILQAWIREVMK